MSSSKFRRLFEPGRIGTMLVKNRWIMPAMGTRYADSEGYVTERLKRYHSERARGGVGLIVTEITAVEFAGRHTLTAADDSYIPGLAELADVIHEGGAKAALQLWHPGRQARSSATGSQPVAPSPLASPGGEVPRELAPDEIRGLVGRFADAAARARKAGFDAVEIHGAHGYLVAQFLSPASNHRRDEYGGPVEKRARFLMEIIEAIRAVVGRDFPVWCRIDGQQYGVEDGISIEDAKQVAQMAEAAGVDAVHVSAAGFMPHESATIPVTPGILVPLAEEVKRAVEVPVIAVGRLDPELAEAVLKERKADFVSMGRRLIADPGLPNKALADRLDDVRPCIACNECIDNIPPAQGMHCAVNPGVGTQHENRIEPASPRRKVLVVGGGPAGMEAATVAALRGHDVTLAERASALGGQLNLAAVPPGKDELSRLLKHLTARVHEAGVRVELGVEVTPEYLDQLRPDVAVFATGVLPGKPDRLVVEGASVLTPEDVLLGREPVGQEVVVVGGGTTGCETARYLASQGRAVTIVERLDTVAPQMGRLAKGRLLGLLAAEGVTLVTGAECRSIKGKELTVVVEGNQQRTITADTFVLATGSIPNQHLFAEGRRRVPEAHLIGDASQPRSLGDALRDGFEVGHSI